MNALAILRSRGWEVGLTVALLVAGIVGATTVATRSTARRTAAGVEWVLLDTGTGSEPRIVASSRRDAILDAVFRAWTSAGGTSATAAVRVSAAGRSYYAASSLLPAGDGRPARRLVTIAPASVEFSSGALVMIAAAIAGMLLVMVTGARSNPGGTVTLADVPRAAQTVESGRVRNSLTLSDDDLARVATTPQSDLLAPDASAREERLLPGYLFADRYEIMEMLGRSDVRTAYRVRDRELSKLVVLKTLHPGAFGGDAGGVAQFKADLRVVRRLAHRNILRTYDFGQATLYYVTMELVDATPLHDLLLQEGRLGVNATLSIAAQASRALSVAHHERVLHRDIRPHSLLLEADGVLKVADFGLATTAQRTRALAQTSDSTEVIAYVPPEVLRAQAVDARSDLYSLAVVLYRCLAGRLPTDAAEPLSSIDPTVPQVFSDLVSETLSSQPALRPASADEFRHRLALVPETAH